jgi:hypothetical protein
MAKERIAAIVIGLIMIVSAAGFALNSAVNQGGINTSPKINIPTIVTRPLTTDELVYVLSGEGKVIIEYSYQNDTVDQNKIATLESFAQQRSDFVVLSEYSGNETSLNMIGYQGKIVDLGNMTLSNQNLMTTFCGIAIAQPPECLM